MATCEFNKLARRDTVGDKSTTPTRGHIQTNVHKSSSSSSHVLIKYANRSQPPGQPTSRVLVCYVDLRWDNRSIIGHRNSSGQVRPRGRAGRELGRPRAHARRRQIAGGAIVRVSTRTNDAADHDDGDDDDG